MMFTSPRTLITTSLFLSALSNPQYREQDGEPGIDHDDEKHGLDDRPRGKRTDARGVAFDLKPLETADKPDGSSKNGSFDHTHQERLHLNRFMQLTHERRHRDAEVEIAHHRAADHRHDIGIEGQKWQRDDQS